MRLPGVRSGRLEQLVCGFRVGGEITIHSHIFRPDELVVDFAPPVSIAPARL